MFTSSFNQNNQSSGLFGAQANKPQGGGLFQSFAPSSTPNQNTNAGGGLFGQSQNQNAGGGLFGQSTQGQGVFGSNNNQGQGVFGANQGFGAQQQNKPFQGNSPFGNQNQNQGSFFGQNQQTNQSNVFGQNNTQQGGLFGQPQNQTSGGGLFGQSNPSQPQGNQGLFGQNQNQNQNQNQGAGLFGVQNNNTNTSSGLFGATSNTNNQSFLGAGNQNQGSNLFGANNQPQQNSNLFGATTNQSNSLFGGPSQNQPQNQSLFGAPNNNTNPSGNSLFGGFGNTNTTNTNSSSLFGSSNSNMSGFGGNTGNKLGGTSWGVPTPAQPTAQGVQNFQPVRSKNSKLDGKHLVKCIAALDQFQGCSKEEIRINFIQSGGQQPIINQQAQNQSSLYVKPQNNGPITSLPSFGGANTSAFGQSNTNTGTSSLFGGQPQGNTLFGASNPTTTQPQGSSLFGGQSQPQGNSLFGQSQPQGNSLFGGQSQPQNTSLFGGQAQPQGNSLFGGQSQQQGTTLFGAQPQGNSLFGGQSQPQATSLFGAQPQPQGNSLFGGQSQPQQNTSLFGVQPQGNSLFGGQSLEPQGTSLFGASTPLQAPPSLLNQAGATPLYPQNPQTAQPYTNPMPNPFNNSQFSQLISPLFQQQQQMDPNLQLLLPQLLLSMALNQNNQNSQPLDPGAQGSNPTLQMLNKLITSMSTSKQPQANSKNINTLLNPTPFDQFLKEEASSKWSERQSERRSLFSEAEIRQFQELDSKNYMDKLYAPEKLNEDSFQLKHTYKPQNKKPDPFGQSNYRVISRSYRANQEQARRKYTPTSQDLPQLGNYTISPSLEKLKNMTILQLKKCDKVKISNSFGSIEFLEPISLYKLDVSGSVKIAQDNIQILDPELEEKRVRMTFNNFGNYVNLKSQQRVKLMKRMRLWIGQCNMEEISHDEDNGELVVQTID